jgi:hypothetical protein
MTMYIELTDERGRTSCAAKCDGARVAYIHAPRAIVCWSLVHAPCWAYVARTHAVSLGARATEAAVGVRRVERDVLAVDWAEGVGKVRRAVSGSGRAHAERAVMLIAKHVELPRELWMLIAHALADMCEGRSDVRGKDL